jgi:hypothetical protein
MYDQYYTVATTGGPTSYGTLMDIYGKTGHLDSQLYFGEAGQLLYRYAFYGQSSWNAWQTLITNSNYNSYAPTLAGV